MLPTAPRVRSSSSASRSNNMFALYLRRIVKWQQMDIQYTCWQMLHLCTSPKVVYQHAKYHKQTKNQRAPGDPAFVVISSLLLVVAVSAYCAAYDHSVAHAVFVIISVFFSIFFLLELSYLLFVELNSVYRVHQEKGKLKLHRGTTAWFGPEFTMVMQSIIRTEVRNYMTVGARRPGALGQ